MGNFTGFVAIMGFFLPFILVILMIIAIIWGIASMPKNKFNDNSEKLK